MMQKNPSKALLVLRLGLAFVFVWFAAAQFSNPERWTSFLPSFVSALPISAVAFVKLNALVEIVGGILIALGVWTRLAALVLAIHLFGIAITIGFDALGVRDMGLAIATLAIAIGGAGNLSFDEKSESKIMLP